MDLFSAELTWTKLYQFPPWSKGNKRRRELILRPKYPRIVNENQVPHVSEVSETIVIVCDSWKVGDLVDWMNTGCFWSGRITQLFNDQEAQVIILGGLFLGEPTLMFLSNYKLESNHFIV